jgi:hypothetical protein
MRRECFVDGSPHKNRSVISTAATLYTITPCKKGVAPRKQASISPIQSFPATITLSQGCIMI